LTNIALQTCRSLRSAMTFLEQGPERTYHFFLQREDIVHTKHAEIRSDQHCNRMTLDSNIAFKTYKMMILFVSSRMIFILGLSKIDCGKWLLIENLLIVTISCGQTFTHSGPSYSAIAKQIPMAVVPIRQTQYSSMVGTLSVRRCSCSIWVMLME
jgi:hypothetical protein